MVDDKLNDFLLKSIQLWIINNLVLEDYEDIFEHKI